MAAGKAVASTNVGDIQSMVAPSNIPYIKGSDADILAGSINALLSDNVLRTEIGRENKTVAIERYSEQAMFDAWFKLYDRLSAKA